MDILKKHGSSFQGTTSFVKHFSLNPFLIIMGNNEILKTCTKAKILFIDDTFSMLNTSVKLMAIITIKEGKGK